MLKILLKKSVKIFCQFSLLVFFLIKKRLAPSFYPEEYQNIRSILLIETALLGDVVVCSPLIKHLHECFPKASLSVVVQKSYIPLLCDNPFVARVIGLKDTRISTQLCLIKELREIEFDLVISTSPGIRNTFLALCISKKFATGYLANRTSKTYYFNDHLIEGIGTTQTFVYKKEQHIVLRALMTLLPLGLTGPIRYQSPILFLDEKKNLEKLGTLLRNRLIQHNKINLVVHPCASKPWRQWPQLKMAKLLNTLYSNVEGALNVVLVGIDDEKEFIEGLSDNLEFECNACIGEDLETVMALIQACDFFIGSDSGPKFIAYGFNKKLVELLGPQLPETVGAQSQNSIQIFNTVGCNPCHQAYCHNGGRCVATIQPDQVVEAVASLGLKRKK